jgi:tetratricopeptide (TPR) repeat protein
MYVPLIGISIVIAWGLAALTDKWRFYRLAYGLIFSMLLMVLSIYTWRQVAHWQSTLTIFEHALVVTEKNDVAHANLGVTYGKMGDLEKAIEHHSEVIRIKPKLASAWRNLGKDMEMTNQFDKAVEFYRKALDLKADHEAHFNLANALRETKEIDQALAHYRKALEIKGDYAPAHGNLAATLTLMKRYDQAMQHYQRALEIDPEYADAHSNYAATLEILGKRDQALYHYQEALRINPQHPNARKNFEKLNR